MSDETLGVEENKNKYGNKARGPEKQDMTKKECTCYTWVVVAIEN